MLQKDVKKIDKHTDFFFHYDSEMEKVSEIQIFEGGDYFVTITNIRVDFEDGIVPDIFTGYICIDETQMEQTGIVRAAGNFKRKLGGILFPIYNPGGTEMKCKIYNIISLKENDSIKLKFLCKNLSPIPTRRIVCTIHCTKDLKRLIIL